MGYLSDPVLQYKTESLETVCPDLGEDSQNQVFGHCFIQRESIRVDPENKISF